MCKRLDHKGIICESRKWFLELTAEGVWCVSNIYQYLFVTINIHLMILQLTLAQSARLIKSSKYYYHQNCFNHSLLIYKFTNHKSVDKNVCVMIICSLFCIFYPATAGRILRLQIFETKPIIVYFVKRRLRTNSF